MFRFISFGSGSSGNCYYLFTEHGGILIDVGIGVRMLKKYFDQYGLKLSEIRAIIVTHDHADHVKSVGSMSRDYFLPVYATQKVHSGIDRNYIVRHKIDAASRRIVNVGEQFEVAGMTITAVSVPHDSNDNVGYEIEYDGKTFSLMTDAGHVTSEMGGVISRSNYLVFESNHEVEKLRNGRYPMYLKQRILSPNGHLSNEDVLKLCASMPPRRYDMCGCAT